MTTTRQNQWVMGALDFTLAAGAIRVDQMDTSLVQRAGSTMTRLVAAMDVRVQSINLTTTLAWGVYLGTTRERVSGGTPFPLTPTEIDWLCWEHRKINFGAASGTSVDRFPCDLRGQRRYRSPDSELLLITENLIAGSGVDLHWSWRALIKLG